MTTATTSATTDVIKRAPAGVYFFIQSLVRALVRLLTRHTVVGLENFPKDGPFIVASNHLSMMDAPVVYINCPRRMVVFAADKWKTTPGIKQLVETVGVIWVTRGEADMDAIKISLAHLKAGGIIGMAPEGTRSHTASLQKGKTGVAYLASRANAPIVPVAITGTQNVGASLKRLRRAAVTYTIGQPFHLPAEGRAKGEKLEEYTDLIMCHIAALLPPEYRGVYRDHPLLERIANGE
jgi:1-acyl-sn-glycerol-3-phosphate acyltransferase